MDDCALFLKTQFPHLKIEPNYQFTKHACIGCGGEAKLAVYPQSKVEIISVIEKIKNSGLAYVLLGNLSNVLPPDGEYQKIPVITKGLDGIQIEKGELYVEAGVSSGKLLQFCKERGLSGAEFLTGIPCTLGGATYMNAGVSGMYISEITSAVLAYVDGKLVKMSNAECTFSYKHTAFMQKEIVILGTYLRLKEKSLQEIQASMSAYAQKRKHLPTGKSMGCVFKNPLGYSAGELIDCSGLKGVSFGGAKVSEKHANFIINEASCQSKDVVYLIEKIKKEVAQKYDVRLQEEIIYI